MKITAFVLIGMAMMSGVAPGAEVQKTTPGRRNAGLPTGGFLEVPQQSKVIQLVNAGGCSDAMFVSVRKLVESSFSFPVATEAIATKGPLDPNSVARVVLVSNDESPILLCAPDAGWSEVNTKPLLADDPNDFAFRQRIQKETMRALAYALGCGLSSARPCLMSEAETLTQIDALPKTYGPEPMAKTAYTARSRGAVARKFVSYRIACEQGWAPEPTNEVQRVIWEKIKTEQSEQPSNPLKITPGMKPKGK